MNLTINPYRAVNNQRTLVQRNSSEVSFGAAKLSKNPKLTTSLSALAASALAAIGIKKKQEKSQESIPQQEKIERNPIAIAKEENPEFVKGLRKMQHVVVIGRDDDMLIPDFSDDAIVILHRENKRDPRFAYELSKYVRSSGRWPLKTPAVENIVNALKTQPKLLEERYYPGNPEATSNLISKLDEPELKDDYLFLDDLGKETGKRFNFDELLKMHQIYAMNPTAVVELTRYKNSDNAARYFRVDDIDKLSGNYDEDREIIKELVGETMSQGYNGSFATQIFDSYKENPELTTRLMNGYRPTLINEIVRTNKIAPKYVKMAMKNDSMNLSDISDFAKKAQANDSYFETLKAKNPKISINISEIADFNTIKDEDKKHVDRIIADGRISSIKEIMSLIPIYRRFEGREVTDEMIRIAQDPMSKYFNI